MSAAGRLVVRPSWEEAEAGGEVDVVVDPGRAFGTGGHATTRCCLELLLALADRGLAAGPLADWGTGSGVLAIAAAKLGWDPVSGCDHEPAAVEAAAANAAANGADVAVERLNLREQAPPAAPTVVANLTAPLLVPLAERMAAGEIAVPGRMVVSGLLRERARARHRGLRRRRPRRRGGHRERRLGRAVDAVLIAFAPDPALGFRA